MKTLMRSAASRLLALLAACALAFAPVGAGAQPVRSYAQAELDQMLAPIALYPDALLSQILLAAAYPLEVADAARWARARPDLSGDEAIRAAEGEDWDPSVKSLLAFPQVLVRMGESPQWVQALGDAFRDQQAWVMDTVQALRRKAQAAGNLRTDDRQRVIESAPGLLLQPVNPQIVYVPYYDPQLVYGPWWWPAYPPVYLRPWPGYYPRPAYAGGLYWGPPVRISAVWFPGFIDWRLRLLRLAQANQPRRDKLRTTRAAIVGVPAGGNAAGAWHQDPDQRRGLVHRNSDAPRRFGAEARLEPRLASAPAAVMRIEMRQRGMPPEMRSGVPPMRGTPIVRPEPPRAAPPHLGFNPTPRGTHREAAVMTAARPEPFTHRHAPPRSAAGAEIRPYQAQARPWTGR
jgi:hypothetical protein